MSVLLLVLVWRIGLFITSYITVYFSEFTPRFPYSDIYLIPSGLPEWLWTWANFDGVHYLSIGLRGYFAQFTQAFFPIYPLLLKIISFVIQDKFGILSGLFIANIGFFASIFIFKKLLELDYKRTIVFRILLIAITFPTSFYFGALYTEGFFFLLVILSFYFARKKYWVAASFMGLLASGTRITGVFLLPALLYEWIHENRNLVIQKTKQSHSFYQNVVSYAFLLIRSPILYLVPLGLVGYMVYLQFTFGDALYFWHAQPAFGAARSTSIILPPQVIWRYLKILFTVHTFSYMFWIGFLELFSYLFGFFTIYIGYRLKVRPSYIIFALPVILVPALTGTFSSVPRYLLLAFPIYILLGLVIKSKLHFYLLIFTQLVGLLFLTSLYIRGLWVA